MGYYVLYSTLFLFLTLATGSSPPSPSLQLPR